MQISATVLEAALATEYVRDLLDVSATLAGRVMIAEPNVMSHVTRVVDLAAVSVLHVMMMRLFLMLRVVAAPVARVNTSMKSRRYVPPDATEDLFFPTVSALTSTIPHSLDGVLVLPVMLNSDMDTTPAISSYVLMKLILRISSIKVLSSTMNVTLCQFATHRLVDR